MPMWNATIDIAGLYAMDSTIFDDMVFPTATVITDLDNDGTDETYNLSLTDEEKTNIIDMILMKSEGRCVRYEDPDTFKNRLAIISKHESLDKWSRAMYYSFFCRAENPTYNVFEFTNEQTTRQNGRTLTYKYSNYKETSEQTADGKNNTSFSNYVETDEQVTAGVHERHGANVRGDGGAGNSSVSVTVVQGNSDGYGSVNGALPISESETSNDKLTENIGKIEHSKEGAINVALSQGKIEKGISGEKSEVETFAATPDIFTRIRKGNIGVTKSGEIIRDTFDTEVYLDIQNMIIDDVIDNLALAVF